MSTTDKILARLEALHPKSIDLSLERLERLLAALDHPEAKLPPVVHVAGTNGKGSTVAFLRAFCEAAGLCVHVYTSPHLVTFNERIRVAGTLISDAALAAALGACETANQGQPITFFEITTAAAFLAFSRTPADIVLLETGLGGRLDATNVIAQPRLTCITPVSLDHQHFLGHDVATILGEKAGILKPSVPCVAAQQGSKALEMILVEAAQLVGAPLLSEDQQWSVRTDPERLKMVFSGHTRERAFSLPHLVGDHQVRNAALAIACADALGPDFPLSDAAIERGLATVEWPGRLQPLTTGPVVQGVREGWELWLDGGHNKAAGEVLAQHALTWRDKDLWLVFGALNVRDPSVFLKPLVDQVAGVFAVTIPGQENALTVAAGVQAARELGLVACPATTVVGAIQDIQDQALRAGLSGGRILICGSLYLVGHVLAQNSAPE